MWFRTLILVYELENDVFCVRCIVGGGYIGRERHNKEMELQGGKGTGIIGFICYITFCFNLLHQVLF
jgi:hypothetical protein